MGLVAKPSTQSNNPPHENCEHVVTTTVDELYESLLSSDELVRREVVKNLGKTETGIEFLLTQLLVEQNNAVIEAIFKSLSSYCCDEKDRCQIIDFLLEKLPSMEAKTRNSTILFLSSLPTQMQRYMPALLASKHKDIQLYALDIIRSMNHPNSPEWLINLMKQKSDLHVNVLISLVDRIADFQVEELTEDIKEIAHSSDEPLLAFSARLAIQRIGGKFGNVY